jgi:hypothetical protein
MEDPYRELRASGLLIHQLSRTTGAGRVPAPVAFFERRRGI